jgi:hypothetical protein
VGARVVERRRFRERREHRRLGDVQLPRGFSEVDLRRRRDAVRPRPQVDLVQVQLEDRVLRKVVLDLDGDARLLDLPRDLLFAADLLRENVARELHGDRGRALRAPQGHDVRLEGPEDAPVVDPVMPIEPLVLDGDERLPHGEGNLVQGEHGAALEPELGDQAAVGRIDLRGLLRPGAANQPRDAGAALRRAHARPGAVGEPGAVAGEEHRGPDQTRTDPGILPPGGGAGQ